MPTTWIPSAEAFGTPSLGLTIGAIGIPSAEAFGTATVTFSSVILVQPVGISSGEAFGSPTTELVLGPVGIPSAEVFGVTDVNKVITALLCSATVSGRGQLLIGQRLVSGTVTGAGVLEALSFIRILPLGGATYGLGQLTWSGPGLLEGSGVLTGVLLWAQVPPPICGPICGCGSCCGRREEECPECWAWHDQHHHQEAFWWQCRGCWERHSWHRRSEEHHRGWAEANPQGLIPNFKWNQTFGRGDLEVCFQDNTGNPASPFFVGYTMYTVSSTGVLHRAGPLDRKPAKADVGKFYVTGTAGENGQPGCWAVKWRYQMTYSSPIVEQLVQFRVLDAVLDCNHRDDVRRQCKYGWDL